MNKTDALFFFFILTGSLVLLYTGYSNTTETGQTLKIVFQGEIQRQNKTFVFNQNLSTLGKARFKDETVFIKSGRTKRKVLKTCNHEMIHLLFPEYRHPEQLPENILEDPVYRLAEYTELPVCNNVINTVLKKQAEKSNPFL